MTWLSNLCISECDATSICVLTDSLSNNQYNLTYLYKHKTNDRKTNCALNQRWLQLGLGELSASRSLQREFDALSELSSSEIR